MLKPGGKLFLSDGNNASNFWIKKKTFMIWDRFENGPPGMFHTHNIKESLKDQRRKLLAARVPDLSEPDLDRLAQRTFGMSADEVVRAGEEFVKSGVMSSSTYAWGKCPVELKTGMYLESLFHPYQLARQMREMGFDTRVYAYFSHGRHPAIAAVSRALEKVSRLSIYFAPTFQIVATKR